MTDSLHNSDKPDGDEELVEALSAIATVASIYGEDHGRTLASIETVKRLVKLLTTQKCKEAADKARYEELLGVLSWNVNAKTNVLIERTITVERRIAELNGSEEEKL